MKKFLFYLTLLFRFDYWLMNNNYSKQWDAKLNDLMKVNSFIIIDRFTAKLGNYIIWISNHPYASFVPYGKHEIDDVRPSRYTIYKARKKFMKDIFR